MPPKEHSPIKFLTDSRRNELCGLLANLTTRRISIESSMVFCVKHQDCAAEIATILTETIKHWPDRAVPLLYLISDVTHNSLIGSYPALFRAALPATISGISQRLYLSCLIQGIEPEEPNRGAPRNMEGQSSFRR